MKDHLLNDKEKAFDVMFLKETDELEIKRQELGFYTNQSWNEVRRVAYDNSIIKREDLMSMS